MFVLGDEHHRIFSGRDVHLNTFLMSTLISSDIHFILLLQNKIFKSFFLFLMLKQCFELRVLLYGPAGAVGLSQDMNSQTSDQEPNRLDCHVSVYV